MKSTALTRAGLAICLMLMAGEAWSQASSGGTQPKVAPESLSTPSQGSGVSDSVITARAKAALLGAKHVNSGDVHVMTKGGVVKLTGHVASEEQKRKAGETVQSLDGVTAVQNDLTVDSSAK